MSKHTDDAQAMVTRAAELLDSTECTDMSMESRKVNAARALAYATTALATILGVEVSDWRRARGEE